MTERLRKVVTCGPSFLLVVYDGISFNVRPDQIDGLIAKLRQAKTVRPDGHKVEVHFLDTISDC